MSAKFNSLLTDREWAAYKAGQARAQRDSWMHDARSNKGLNFQSTVRVCVKNARQNNHEYLKRVAEYRALLPPQRKRA